MCVLVSVCLCACACVCLHVPVCSIRGPKSQPQLSFRKKRLLQPMRHVLSEMLCCFFLHNSEPRLQRGSYLVILVGPTVLPCIIIKQRHTKLPIRCLGLSSFKHQGPRLARQPRQRENESSVSLSPVGPHTTYCPLRSHTESAREGCGAGPLACSGCLLRS